MIQGKDTEVQKLINVQRRLHTKLLNETRLANCGEDCDQADIPHKVIYQISATTLGG